MSDAGERTEQPTPRRLQKARERGDAPHSPLAAYAASCLLLPLVAISATVFARSWPIAFQAVLQRAIVAQEPSDVARSSMMDLLSIASLTTGAAGLIACVGGVASSALTGALSFAPGALRWRFDKLSPSLGLRSIASRDAGTQTLVALCAVVVVLAAAAPTGVEIIQSAQTDGWQAWCHVAISSIASLWSRASGALGALAVMDITLARKRHTARLRMTAREIRDERAEQEGKPEHKARRRAVAVRRSRRLRVTALKRAAAVVVNPTHVAVALQYAPPAIDVPLVIALGAGPAASIVRAAAAYYDVPIVESPYLARVLFARADVDDPIPEELYSAVAAVFAWLLKTRGRLGGRDDA